MAVMVLISTGLAVHAVRLHHRLDKAVETGNILGQTLAVQQDQLHRLAAAHQEQTQKLIKKEMTALDQELALLELNHRFRTFADDLTTLQEKSRDLTTLETSIRFLAGLKNPDVAGPFQGVGGVDEKICPALSFSFDNNPDNALKAMEDTVAATRQQLTRRLQGLTALQKDLEEKNALVTATPGIKPAKGTVTSPFGYRHSPFNRKREFHSGIDIANRRGTPVHATAGGTVQFARHKWLIGNLVTIDHGRGFLTKYGHLDKILVKEGDPVTRGDIIGLMGNTGNSTGSHVHYEVLVNGRPRNPANYFTIPSILAQKPHFPDPAK